MRPTYPLKYVVTDRGDFVIGTSLTAHRDLARGLYGEPVGAGFIRLNTDKDSGMNLVVADCYGESVSLGLKSRPEKDAKIINESL